MLEVGYSWSCLKDGVIAETKALIFLTSYQIRRIYNNLQRRNKTLGNLLLRWLEIKAVGPSRVLVVLDGCRGLPFAKCKII